MMSGKWFDYRVYSLALILFFTVWSYYTTREARQERPEEPVALSADCYALSQIGYDTVINAALGVSKDHIYRLSSGAPPEVFRVMEDAYNWGAGAPEYRDFVMSACLQRLRYVNLSWEGEGLMMIKALVALEA